MLKKSQSNVLPKNFLIDVIMAFPNRSKLTLSFHYYRCFLDWKCKSLIFGHLIHLVAIAQAFGS